MARQNALNQQWLQVVTEEVLAMEDGGLPDGENNISRQNILNSKVISRF